MMDLSNGFLNQPPASSSSPHMISPAESPPVPKLVSSVDGVRSMNYGSPMKTSDEGIGAAFARSGNESMKTVLQ